MLEFLIKYITYITRKPCKKQLKKTHGRGFSSAVENGIEVNKKPTRNQREVNEKINKKINKKSTRNKSPDAAGHHWQGWTSKLKSALCEYATTVPKT